MSGSQSEIRHREGMPDGGMPYDALLEKLEETDPDLVGEVRGFDALHDIENDYDDYVREEITDWGPDTPFLESDHTRRDPGLSRSVLNLHYNGTRGSNPELPRHPELFYGFTGNDPRGAVNDPRFDQVRGHMTSRAANLTVSMGDNDDHHEAERPWTAQSISYGMKEIHRQLKKNTKIFSVQKEGRPWGRNYVADQFAAGDLRAAQLRAGADGFEDAAPGGGPGARFAAGDHGPAVEMFSDGARGLGVPDNAAAPWRHTAGDTDLGVQQYGQKRGAGRGHTAPGAVGGGRVRAGGADQDWGTTRQSQSTNRQVLGATMAQAARHRAALKSGRPDQAWDVASGYVNGSVPGGGLAPARDVARRFRHAVEDQARRPATEVQDDEGGRLGAASGLTPAAHPEKAGRAGTVTETTPNSYLTNAESIVSGLREGTAAGRRRIAGRIVADGARHLAVAEAEPGARRGTVPAPGDGATGGAVAKFTEIPLARAAAAEGLTVHAYRGAPPPRPDHRVRDADFDPLTWRQQREALPLGASKAPGEFRSHSKDPTTIGDHPDRVFGFTAEVQGSIHGAPTGPKTLRSGGWSDEAGLSDEIGSSFDV